MGKWVRRLGRQFRYGEKGFTLIELLVVVAILGVLAAVMVPNVSKFIGRGKSEAYATELHNIQTAVTAMLTESTTGVVSGGAVATKDMHLITTPGGPAITRYLDEYAIGLGDDPSTAPVETTCVKTGASYIFAADGKVTQVLP